MGREHGRLIGIGVHDGRRRHRESDSAVLIQSRTRSELLGDFESSASRQMIEPLPQLDRAVFIFVEGFEEVIHKHLVVGNLQILQRSFDLVAVQGAAGVACVVMLAERATRNLSIPETESSVHGRCARDHRSAGMPPREPRVRAWRR